MISARLLLSGKISGWEQQGWRAARGNMGCRRNPTYTGSVPPSLLQSSLPSSWHVPAPEEPASLGGVRAAPPARLETQGVHVSAARVGEPRGHLAVPHQAPGSGCWSAWGHRWPGSGTRWAAEMTLPAEWPHPCPLLGPWWGVRRHGPGSTSVANGSGSRGLSP